MKRKAGAKHNYFYMNINEANFGSALRNDNVLLIRMHKDEEEEGRSFTRIKIPSFV